MLIAERNNLEPVKVLISDSLVQLELFQDGEGNLFLSSSTKKPAGMVYYATTTSKLCAFLQDSISLQTLFDATPSVFVELTTKEETAFYRLTHIEIELTCGDKTIKQLTGGSPIEIWEGC